MNYYTLDGKKISKKSADLKKGSISIGSIKEKGEIVGCYYYSPYTTQELINQYKCKLANTDYISAKIADGAATREEYSDMLKQRAEWREQINKLEEELNSNV